MDFQKYHGNGNDFIFLSHDELNHFESIENLREWVRALCHRHTGIGADGVVIFDSFSRVLILNSDGSFAASCGNALRCYGLAQLRSGLWDGLHELVVRRLVPSFATHAALRADEKFILQDESFATLIKGDLLSQSVTVGMSGATKIVLFQPDMSVCPAATHGVFVQLTNPHLVFVSEVFAQWSQEQFRTFGQWAQTDFIALKGFPFPVSNINMVFYNHKNWHVVVFERGAGLTLCCGTGAVATRIALEKLGKIDALQTHVLFELPGGNLDISSESVKENKQRMLSGPAQFVFQGKLTRN